MQNAFVSIIIQHKEEAVKHFSEFCGSVSCPSFYLTGSQTRIWFSPRFAHV